MRRPCQLPESQKGQSPVNNTYATIVEEGLQDNTRVELHLQQVFGSDPNLAGDTPRNTSFIGRSLRSRREPNRQARLFGRAFVIIP